MEATESGRDNGSEETDNIIESEVGGHHEIDQSYLLKTKIYSW